MSAQEEIKEWSDERVIRYLQLADRHKEEYDVDENIYYLILREYLLRGLDERTTNEQVVR